MQLPDKPSDLIDLAINDLERAEKSPNHIVDMARWHEPDVDQRGNVCRVCLAGSVMAFTGNSSPDHYFTPTDFDHDTERKLDALNDFRIGEVRSGLQQMEFDPADFSWRPITSYLRDKSEFKRDMRKLATNLREKGL